MKSKLKNFHILLFIAFFTSAIPHLFGHSPTGENYKNQSELFQDESENTLPEVQKFSILKFPQNTSSQKDLVFGLTEDFDRFNSIYWNATTNQNFFYCLSDKRYLIFKYLFPFHSFW